MTIKRFIPVVAAVVLTSGVAFAGNITATPASSKSNPVNQANAKQNEQILAKCTKEYGSDQAKVGQCVNAKGDFSKVDAAAKPTN